MHNILITPQAFSNIQFEKIQSLFGKEYNIRLTGGQIPTESKLIEELKNVDGCIIGSEPINSEIFSQCPKLKILSLTIKVLTLKSFLITYFKIF